jgi:hypothetical protein
MVGRSVGVNETLPDRWIVSLGLALSVRVGVDPEMQLADHIVRPWAQVTDFGHRNGTLIFGTQDGYREVLEELYSAGYAVSCFREPNSAEYDRSAAIDRLVDWGWSGPNELKPDWLTNQHTRS